MADSKHADVKDPPECILERKGNYRGTCANPFPMGDSVTPYRNQIHHIMCEHAVTDRNPADKSKKSFIDKCLKLASYDINEEPNLIGLPMKSAYITPRATVPDNYCCHNVDHNTGNGYTNECKTWLHDNVWDPLVDKQKTHETNADNIVEALRKCTSTFKGILTKRGKRNGGTAKSWKNRQTEEFWYYPFSMGSDPTPRSPGGGRLPRVLQMLG